MVYNVVRNEGEMTMLKQFKVRNFKNFSEECILDFTKTRDYSFNTYLIKNGLINKALIYGKNGSGKSNLGLAVMDMAIHLSNNQRIMSLYSYPLNGDTACDYLSFEYIFDCGEKDITYSYKKNADMDLLEEEIKVGDDIVFEYNYKTNSYRSTLEELKSFNFDLLKNRNLNTSIIKMIYGYSSVLPDNSPIKVLCEFANNMLWFRSVVGNQFMGNLNQNEDLEQYIVGKGEVEVAKFESFLKDCGLDYQLSIDTVGLNRRIIARFNSKSYPLFDIASTGTRSLWLFYYWMNRCDGHISFLYLDEFDAFYHPKLSLKILREVLSNDKFQAVVTTHNSYLADNSIMRPDCYLILKDCKVKSFADRTNKVIREGHNIEKMMLSDEFE